MYCRLQFEMWWHTVTHGRGRGNWRMEWVASTLHTTSEHGVSSITTADVHTSAASNRLNWHPRRLKWTRPFLRQTKSGFCVCAITFQLTSTNIKMKNQDFWDMTPRRLVNSNWRFGEASYLHIQGGKNTVQDTNTRMFPCAGCLAQVNSKFKNN